MAQGVDEYIHQAALLLQAAEQFEDSLAAGDAEQEFAVDELLGVAQKNAVQGISLRFQGQPGAGLPATRSVSGGLSAIVLELQSANVLVAAGLQKQELGLAGDLDLLHQAQQHVATTRDELSASATGSARFASLNIQSATAESATQAFRTYSGQLLDEIVDEAGNTAKAALKGVAKLDAYQIANALSQIGEAVPIVAGVGVLLRKGIEKLKAAIEALSELFGKDAFDKVRDQIGEIWQQAGEVGRALLTRLLGAQGVKARIEEILSGSSLPISAVDGASNALPVLAAEFARNNKLLRALVRAIDLAAGLLALLSFAGPWLGLALGTAYLSTIGGVLLVGGEYTGGRRLLRWVDGVEQVAERIHTV